MVQEARAGNVAGRPIAFHVAAATAAKTASDERSRGGGVVIEDRNVDLRHLGGPQDPERSNREILRITGFGIDGDALPQNPSQRHVGGTNRVRLQHDLVEGIARRDFDLDVRDSLVDMRTRTSATRRHDVDIATERARYEQRLLGQPRRAELGAHWRTNQIDLAPVGVHLDTVRSWPHTRRTTARDHTLDLDHIGARNGHRGNRRALRPHPHDILAGVDDAHRATEPIGQLARRDGCERVRLAAERAAVRERRRGLTARFAPRRIRLEIGGLDPRRC